MAIKSELFDWLESHETEGQSAAQLARQLIDQGKFDSTESTLRTYIREWRRESGAPSSAKDEVIRWLNEHGDPGGSGADVAKQIVDDIQRSDSISTIEEYVCEWRAQGGGAASADGGPTENKTPDAPDRSHGLDLLERDYYYNETDDVYVVHVDHRPESLVIPGEKARQMKEAYSNWTSDEATINEICRQYGVNRKDFVAIKTAFGWTHDSAPLTDEELVDDRPIDAKVNDLARQRERELERKWQKRKWRETEKDARKWREFEREIAEPMLEGLQSTDVPDVPQPAGQGRDMCASLFPSDGHLDQENFDGGGLNENIGLWLSAHKQICSRIQQIGTPEVAYLVLGSDMFNVDTSGATTTSGTQQQNARRPSAVVQRVAEAGCQAIDIARSVAPTLVVRVVPGNHDEHTCRMYQWGIEGRYAEIEGVEVRGGGEARQYEQYGDNLLMWAHGDKTGGGQTKKAQNLCTIAASERREMWGETSHSFAHVGHLHHSYEWDDGIRVQQVPTSTPPDEWHHDSGYVTAQRSQVAWLYQRSGGQLARVEAPAGA